MREVRIKVMEGLGLLETYLIKCIPIPNILPFFLAFHEKPKLARTVYFLSLSDGEFPNFKTWVFLPIMLVYVYVQFL